MQINLQKLAHPVARLSDAFKKSFGETPRVFRAPGRVNLIGEHTDYSDGFVFPAAIDFFTWAAIVPRSDRRIRINSFDFDETIEFGLDDPQNGPSHHWSDYVRGVALVLQNSGFRLNGANLMIHGEVPLGSGLSSSAALEVASGNALLVSSNLPVDPVALAKICQKAEQQFVGSMVGIMDQFISSNGRRGHALMLDCRSLDYQLVPLKPGTSLIVCNTMVKHDLATGEYNVRRSECEAGVRHLAQAMPNRKISALRDVTMEDLETYGAGLPPVIFKRCRHVISEDDRVLKSVKILEAGDIAGFGILMAASHRSLRDDFAVSCRELDLMVEVATPYALGARMTGGGFGGCTINLVRQEAAEDFQQKVSHEYQNATGIKPEIYICNAADGAQEVTPEMDS